MAKREQFVCDVCGVEKKESNHWWKFWRDTDPVRMIIVPWNTPFVEEGHLCGHACVIQRVSEFMGKPNTQPAILADSQLAKDDAVPERGTEWICPGCNFRNSVSDDPDWCEQCRRSREACSSEYAAEMQNLARFLVDVARNRPNPEASVRIALLLRRWFPGFCSLCLNQGFNQGFQPVESKAEAWRKLAESWRKHAAELQIIVNAMRQERDFLGDELGTLKNAQSSAANQGKADATPPIVSNAPPHLFDAVEGNPYCGECGAGKLHAVHQL